jgi:hypothetical protein
MALLGYISGRQAEWLTGWAFITISWYDSSDALSPDFLETTTWLHCRERAGGEQFMVKDLGKYAQDSQYSWRACVD